jgi:hypothetical protein
MNTVTFSASRDEYSRTNPAMHTILHGVTPDIAERQHMDAQLNEQVSRTIILEATYAHRTCQGGFWSDSYRDGTTLYFGTSVYNSSP